MMLFLKPTWYSSKQDWCQLIVICKVQRNWNVCLTIICLKWTIHIVHKLYLLLTMMMLMTNDPDNICLFNFLCWLFLTLETWHIVLPIQLWFKRFKSNIVKSILFQNWNKNKKEIHVHVHVVVWLFKGW